MSKITVIPATYGQWGNCVAISNGTVELIASLDFGPRIIRYGFVGGENLFFEDKNLAITQQGEAFAPVGGGEWRIYGGHRLWVSPEAIPSTTYPDNDKVSWTVLADGVILKPEVEKWNQLQKEIEIRLSPLNGEVTVIHRITNLSPWAIEFAPWALSVMAPGGKAIIPQVKRGTGAGILANRVFSLWPYSKMNDKRVYWGDLFITLQQDSEMPPFKFGSNNEEGWAAYYLHDNLFVKTYDHNPEATYPDYGVSFEAYTNQFFLELETLGALKSVKSAETVTHQEKWNLYQTANLPITEEVELAQAMESYIRKD